MPSREAPIRLPVTKIVSQWRKSFGAPPFVISSPSTMLRTGYARNPCFDRREKSVLDPSHSFGMTTRLLEIATESRRRKREVGGLILRENLGVSLRCLGAAAYVDGVALCEAKLVAKLHQQFVTTLDRNH